MSEDEKLPEYRQGDTVCLTVRLQDENGVEDANALAFLLVNGEPDKQTLRHRVDISGWPEREASEAEIVLSGEIAQQPPGVYECAIIVAANAYQALTGYDLDPPRRFRIVEHVDDVRTGPEVLSVGEFW